MSSDDQNTETAYDTVRDDDGKIVSSTATTTDAGGNVVSVVERTFDADGNVTSATYTDHSIDADTGDTTTDITSYENGVITGESSTTTNTDGVVVESTVTTFESDGDPDTTESRTFDAGGAPLESQVMVYADDGELIMTTVQTETGQTTVSYEPGDHTRTTTAADGSVTNEQFGVLGDGVLWSKKTRVADASGEIQSSHEYTLMEDNESVLTRETEFVDGKVASTTTTLSEEEGTSVKVTLGDPSDGSWTEVSTRHDAEGNVTDRKYVEYEDRERVYEGDEPRRAEFFEQLAEHREVPDLPEPETSLDASDVLSQQMTGGPSVPLDGDAFAGVSVADDVRSAAGEPGEAGASADAPEVVWTKSDDGVGGVSRELTGYADGSILIATSATSVFGVEAGSHSEHIFPDGTRSAIKPLDKAVTEGLGLDVGSLATFEEMWAGAGDVTLTYGADGALTGAEWFTPQGTGGVGGQIVVADGSLTKTVQTFDHGDVVDTRVETSPLPAHESADADPAAPVRNPDGSVVQTTTFDAGDVAIEHKIVEADGSIRSITHFNDGSVALTSEAGDIERIFGDGTTELSSGSPISLDFEPVAPAGDDADPAVEDLTPDDGNLGDGAVDSPTVDAGAFEKVEFQETGGDEYLKIPDIVGESSLEVADIAEGAYLKLSGPTGDEFHKVEDLVSQGDEFLKFDATGGDVFVKVSDVSAEGYLKIGDIAGESKTVETAASRDLVNDDPSLDPNLGLWDQSDVDPSLDPNLGLWDQSDEASLKIGDIAGESRIPGGDQFDAGESEMPMTGYLKTPGVDDGSVAIGETGETGGGRDYPQTDVFSETPEAEALPDPFAPAADEQAVRKDSGEAHLPAPDGDVADVELGESLDQPGQPQFDAVATVGDDAQLADPFTPVSDVVEEIKVTYAEPEDVGAKEPVEFDDPLAAPAASEQPDEAAAWPAKWSPADEVVVEPVQAEPVAAVVEPEVELPAVQKEPVPEVVEPEVAVVEPEVELPAVQKEPAGDLTDVDVTAIAEAPTFEEPIDHSAVREALDLDGPELDLDGLPDAGQLDDGLSG